MITKTTSPHNLLRSLLAGASTLAAASLSGQTHLATISNSDDASYSVSDADLLQTAFDSYNGSLLDDRAGSAGDTGYLQGLTPSGEESLRDGVWFSNAQSRGSAMVENNEFAEFALDLTASPSGYTINGVDLYSNWGTGAGRNEIRVNVSFSLVATPTVFDQTLVGPEEDPLFVYNPNINTQAKMALSGFSIPGVAAIRFDWPSPQENSGVGYSELDVFGVSTGGDIDRPSLSSSVPVNSAIDVPTVAPISLTFNEDIQAGSGTIDLRTSTPDASVETFDVASSGQLTFDGRTLTITPSSALATGTEYYLVVPTDVVEDTSSNGFLGIPALPDLSALSFTTDDTPPTLAGSPVLINLLPTNDLTIQLDEAAEIGTGTLTIHLASDDSIVQTINLPTGASVDGDTVVFDIADLAFDTAYYVNFTAGSITDLSGNILPAVTDAETIAFTTVATTFIHHWEFDTEPPVDSIGTHDGTLAGGASLAEGLFGNAVLFTAATGHRVEVNQPSLPATNFTFACWVNRDPTGGTNSIAGTKSSNQGGAFLVLNGAAGTPVLTLQTDGTVVTLSATQDVSAEEWTHLAYTVDETNGAVIYVNGIAAGTEAAATGHTVLDNFMFGRAPDVLGTNPYEGLIDEARVYAEVLTPAQIAALAVAPSMAGPELAVVQNGGLLDFSWNSMSGMQYDLVSATDLSTPVATWAIYDDGVNPPYEDIPFAGMNTSLSGVTRVGPTRFFAIVEEEIPPILSEDFEASASIPAGWVASDNGNGTAWVVGASTASTGPLAAANGANSAGTNLDVYGNDANATLTSPAFFAPAEGATLSFEQFIDTEEASGGPDFGSVRLLDADNGDAEIIDGLFPVTPIEGVGGDWTQESFALPAAALGKNIKVQFVFVSDSGGLIFSGFYIDDVQVTP